jgi:DNA-binding NarL/FixJ family response regulator
MCACGTVLAALKAGAAGYLLKSTRRRELLLLIGT